MIKHNKIMSKYKLFAVFAFLFALGLQCWGQRVSEVLVVEHKDGVESFKLSEKPSITFDNGSLNIKSRTFSAKIDDVKKAYFQPVYPNSGGTINPDDPDPTTEISKLRNTLQYTFVDGRTFIVEGLSENEVVRVYNLSGMKIDCRQDFYNQTRTIHLDNCPRGVYIIKVRNNAYKIIKK